MQHIDDRLKALLVNLNSEQQSLIGNRQRLLLIGARLDQAHYASARAAPSASVWPKDARWQANVYAARLATLL